MIEGVGAGRASLAPMFDAVVWIQSDPDITARRDRARVETGELDVAGYEGWMSEERPFQAQERTWERADLLVSGSSAIRHDPASEIVVLGRP